MIRAALASLVSRRFTPSPPPPDSPPSPRPTFIGRRVNINIASIQGKRYLIEHGSSPVPFVQAIRNDLDHNPRLLTVLIRALHQYIDDHGPIGEGTVIIYTGTDWTASFLIEENPRGAIRALYLVNAGPDSSVADWISYSPPTLG